jgi:hypothetical protein
VRARAFRVGSRGTDVDLQVAQHLPCSPARSHRYSRCAFFLAWLVVRGCSVLHAADWRYHVRHLVHPVPPHRAKQQMGRTNSVCMSLESTTQANPLPIGYGRVRTGSSGTGVGAAYGSDFAVSSAIADISLAIALVWKLRSVSSSFKTTQRFALSAAWRRLVLTARVVCFVGSSLWLSRLVCVPPARFKAPLIRTRRCDNIDAVHCDCAPSAQLERPHGGRRARALHRPGVR